MTKTQLQQELRKMRFEKAYAGWNQGRLSQSEAAQLLVALSVVMSVCIEAVICSALCSVYARRNLTSRWC